MTRKKHADGLRSQNHRENNKNSKKKSSDNDHDYDDDDKEHQLRHHCTSPTLNNRTICTLYKTQSDQRSQTFQNNNNNNNNNDIKLYLIRSIQHDELSYRL